MCQRDNALVQSEARLAAVAKGGGGGGGDLEHL